MPSHPSTAEFTSASMIILVADLSGFARQFSSHSDSEMVAFLDRFYSMAQAVVDDHGGQVIKFMGDAILCAFPPEAASEAVSAAATMGRAVEEMVEASGMGISFGANIHLGDVIGAELGSGASRRFDVIGRTVNQAFLLGRGGGIRLSERVYRKLPSAERAPWQKRKPPALYVLADSGEPYTGLGKTPNQNAQRW